MNATILATHVKDVLFGSSATRDLRPVTTYHVAYDAQQMGAWENYFADLYEWGRQNLQPDERARGAFFEDGRVGIFDVSNLGGNLMVSVTYGGSQLRYTRETGRLTDRRSGKTFKTFIPQLTADGRVTWVVSANYEFTYTPDGIAQVGATPYAVSRQIGRILAPFGKVFNSNIEVYSKMDRTLAKMGDAMHDILTPDSVWVEMFHFAKAYRVETEEVVQRGEYERSDYQWLIAKLRTMLGYKLFNRDMDSDDNYLVRLVIESNVRVYLGDHTLFTYSVNGPDGQPLATRLGRFEASDIANAIADGKHPRVQPRGANGNVLRVQVVDWTGQVIFEREINR